MISNKNLSDLAQYQAGMIQELERYREEERKTCKWHRGLGTRRESECGHGFYEVPYTWTYIQFCPWCGKRIEEAE